MKNGGGRRRKLYRLEPAGAVALQRAYRALQGMAEGTETDLSALVADAGTEGEG